MCGGHCSCCEGSCVRLLNSAEHDALVRSPMRMSFTPHPAVEPPEAVLANLIGLP